MLVVMAVLRILCWALVFLLQLEFPPGESIADTRIRIRFYSLVFICRNLSAMIVDEAFRWSATVGVAGGSLVVQVLLNTVTRDRFRLLAVILLNLPWSQVVRVLSSFTLPGFPQVFRFPPGVTPDPGGVALTRYLERTAKQGGTVIQYK